MFLPNNNEWFVLKNNLNRVKNMSNESKGKQKATKKIVVRLQSEQYEVLLARANQAGFSELSSYMRFLLATNTKSIFDLVKEIHGKVIQQNEEDVKNDIQRNN